MSRSMWVLAALFAILAISMIFQSGFNGGIDRPWAECKENLVTQMFSGQCTPRSGGFAISPGPESGGTGDAQIGGTQDGGSQGTGNGLDSNPLVEKR